MSALHPVLILALALMGLEAGRDAGATVEPPKISRPKAAPPASPGEVPPLPPAVFDPALAIGGKDVKAKEVETRLSVDVQVNGHGPYKFIVDSGADTSAVGLRIAHDLELPLGTPAIVNGMTSRDLVDRVKVDQLTLGPTTVRNLELPALREADVGGDGLIGIDALTEQRLMMDFEKHLIKVEDARTPPREFSPDEIVIVAKRRRGQLILTEVRAGRISLEAVIDTGSEISIGNMALRDKLLRRGRDRFWTVDAIGVTGVTAKLQLANVGEVQLGPVTLRDVPMAFADVPPFRLFGLTDQPALLLGTDVLETFRRVSLDFRARKIRFQLRRCEQGVVIGTSPESTLTRVSSVGPEVCGR